MATKRKYQESISKDAVHESRQVQVYGNNPKPAKKLRRFEPPTKRKQAHPSSVNAIKKRIRDVTRKLERSEDLPANVRIEDERALAAYQQELASAEAEKIRQKMIKKYHMVRFFERQKATRLLKKLRKRSLSTVSTEEVETLKKQMHIAEVDLSYTQYYPLSEAYISLYPPKISTTDESDTPKEHLSKPKPPMWTEVEKSMEEGTLDRLRNRVAIGSVQTSKSLERKTVKAKAKPPPAPVDMTGLNRRERRSQRGVKDPRTKNKSMAFAKNEAFGASQNAWGNETNVSQGNDDSDGGFFEN